MIAKVGNFIVFSNLFVAVCAIAMVWQTYYVFHLPLLLPFISFIFFGGLCSYNFHWYLTPNVPSNSIKVRWAVAHKTLHLVLFIVGGFGAVIFLYQLRQYWFWLLVSAFFTFLYSAPKLSYHPFVQLRKIAFGKTLFLSLMWVHATILLPLLLYNIKLNTSHILFALNRFLFIYPLCILFDYRDKEQDKKEGIKSLITYFNEKSIDRFFWICLSGFFVTILLLYYLHFNIGILAALMIPAFILAFLYEPLKKNFSDYLYYFVLDGLTLLSPLLILVF